MMSKTRLESQLARRYCQTFSTGFSSGMRAGKKIGKMFASTKSLAVVPSGAVEQQDRMGKLCQLERFPFILGRNERL